MSRSLVIKSLDYLHLIEAKNDLLLPEHVDDEANIFLYIDSKIKSNVDDIYTEETDYSPHVTDFPNYNLGQYFEKRKRFYRYLNMNGLETGDLLKAKIYDDINERSRCYFNIDLYLRLEGSDLKLFLSKKSPLDLKAWGGHLFKEFRLKILNSENKTKAFSTVLKLIEKCEYCKYHSSCVLGIQLVLYLDLLDILHSRNEMPTYFPNVVKLLQLFIHSQKVIKILFQKYWPDVRSLIDASRQEKYTFFNLWNHSNDKTSADITDLAIQTSIGNAEILLLNGGANNFSYEAYETFKLYVRDIISDMLSPEISEIFIEKLMKDEKSLRIKYRCLQTLFIYYDNMFLSPSYRSFAQSVLKLIWKNTSEPFLTEEDFMPIFVSDENSITFLFLDVWYWYMSIFGVEDITIKQTPRTLRHISAVAIRKELIKCFNFPDGISELPLPKYLKKDLYLTTRKHNISVILS